MAVTPMQIHRDDITAAEVVRQNAMAGTPTAAAARAADIAYLQARLLSALQNSISPSVVLDALRAMAAPMPALPSVMPHGEEILSLPPELPVKPESVAARHSPPPPTHKR
jgi:hypothetical protein